MIKCEVLENFNLKRFNELKNLTRKNKDVEGKLYEGDTFECSEAMADYLTGNNMLNKAFVKVIEVEKKIKEAKIVEETEEKPKKETKKKCKNTKKGV